MIHTSKIRKLLPFCFLVLAAVSSSRAQEQLPRDSDKLIARARQFWQQLVEQRKAAALEFIVPEKRDAFLGGTTLPVLEAKVVGLDFTDSKDSAYVRVAVKVLDPGTPIPNEWTINDHWLWQKNNWYADAAAPKDVFTAIAGGLPPVEAERITKEIAAEFKGPTEELDIGTFATGSTHYFNIPLMYSGKRSLYLEVSPRSVVFLENPSVDSKTKTVQAHIDASSLVGPFRIPLTMKASYQSATVERRFVITGNAFSPITFRQVPEGPLKRGDTLTIFVKNNTKETLPLQYIETGDSLEQLSTFETIEPGGEEKVVFRVIDERLPIHLNVLFKQPVFGSSQYAYHKTP